MLHIGNYSQPSIPRYGSSCGNFSDLKLKIVEKSSYRKPRSETAKVSSAMFYTLDPNFTTVLFSIYARGERVGCSVLPDVFAYTSASAHTLDILPYVHSIGLQLYSIGEYYARIFSQVRVGSVIFLVGVGSLVCWRLWNYWHESNDGPEGDNDPRKDPPPTDVTSKKVKRNFLATILHDEQFVEDINDFEGEDPTLIQGRYFGPETPVDYPTPSYSDYSPASNASSRINTTAPSSIFYQADTSGSIGRKICISSESEVDDLPLDSPLKHNGCVRKSRRKLKSTAKVQSSSSSCSVSPYNMPPVPFKGRCAQVVTERSNYTTRPTFQRKVNEEYLQKLESTNSQFDLQNMSHKMRPESLQVYSTSGRSRIEKNLKEDAVKLKLKHYFANYDSDEGWLRDEGEEPMNEEEVKGQGRRFSREQSLTNLMAKMRRSSLRRGSLEPWRMPLSRDDSVHSNLSSVLLSPAGNLKLKRDDSIASNMSDMSEFSIDFSVGDDTFDSNTLSCLVDIENELDFLKSSVFEMDEEFFRYASRPNPYLLKTTYTESSYESTGSKPDSSPAEDLAMFGHNQRRDSEVSVDVLEKIRPRNSSSNSTAENSLEWESPQHGWSSIKNANTTRYHRSASVGGLPRSQSQEIAPSLEWDNLYFKKYEDEMERVGTMNMLNCIQELNGFDEYKSKCKKQLFLPDHASLELDMEEELKNPSANYANFSKLNLLEMQQYRDSENPASVFQSGVPASSMTTSVDSAIYSAPGSRSGSISPSSQMLSQSMMSSGLGASFSEASPDREFLSGAEFYLAKRRRSINPDIERSTLAPVKETVEHTEVAEPNPERKITDFYLPEDSESEDDGQKLENIVNNNVMGNKFSNKFQNTQPQFTKHNRFEAIGRKVDIVKYAKTEWTGDTPKAITIVKGYEEIPKQLHFQHIRRVRGDNYCGIRSVLFQMMSASLPFPNCQQTYATLMSGINDGKVWLRKYSFANRLPYTEENISNGFSDCLGALDKMVLTLKILENKETVLLNRLNSDTTMDARICEAAKLLILQSCIDLYEELPSGAEDSLLSTILFARETSANPKEFLINHLNCVGNSAGLEQIEMCLLGYALKVTIAVVRPSYFGKDDYICFFPDSHIEDWPKVYLVAEDDRHYNILCS